MEDRDQQVLLNRVAELERRVERLQTRIYSLEEERTAEQFSDLRRLRHDPERATSVPPAPPVPPPVVSPRPLRQLPPSQPWDVALKPVVQPAATKPTVKAIDWEDKIGAWILPRLGALVLLIGVLFLVAISLRSGRLTPAVQWIGELSLCGLFVAFGLWKRNEREDFGQVLIGIGSCGLYFSFAGAHAFKVNRFGSPLIDGEMLVAAFMVLGFANLAFSVWRSSKSFLAIGLLGGLVGATLPMREFNSTVSAALHFLIVVPAAIVVWRNRWFYTSIGALFFSSAALVFVLTSSWAWEWRIVTLYANTLLWLVVYARAYRITQFDPQGVLVPAAALGAALAAWAMQYGPEGSGHVLLFGVVLAIAAALTRGKRREVSDRFFVSALVVPSVLAPFGWAPSTAALIFGVLALAYSALSSRFAPRVSSALAGVVLAIGLATYATSLAALEWRPPRELDIALAVLFSGATVAVAWAAARIHKHAEWYAVAAAIVLIPLMAQIGLETSRWPYLLSATVAMVMYSVPLSLISYRQRWLRLAFVAWSVLIFGLVAYGSELMESGMVRGTEQLLLSGFIAASLLAGYVVAKVDRGTRESIVVAVGLLVAAEWTRLSIVSLSPGVHEYVAATIGACSFSAMAAVFAMWRRLLSGVIVAWLAVLGGMLTYMSAYGAARMSWQTEAGLVVAFLGLMVLVGSINMKLVPTDARSDGKQTLLACIGVFFGAFFMHGAFVVLSSGPAAWQSGLSLAVACLTFSSFAGLLAWRTQMPGLAAVAYIFTIVFAWPYLETLSQGVSWSAEMLLLIGAAFTVCLSLMLSTSSQSDRRTLLLTLATVMWVLVSRLFFVVLSLSGIGLEGSAAVTIAWTAYAIALLAVGFVKAQPLLRYFALTVFGCTVAKLLLVDLSFLSIEIRAWVFLILGFTMIAGGYWYVRARRPEVDAG